MYIMYPLKMITITLTAYLNIKHLYIIKKNKGKEGNNEFIMVFRKMKKKKKKNTDGRSKQKE